MSHVNEYKIKLLVLWDILCRFTDEEHPNKGSWANIFNCCYSGIVADIF